MSGGSIAEKNSRILSARVNSLEAGSRPAFAPTIDQIYEMGRIELADHKLKKICYSVLMRDLCKVTFCFGEGYRSPPFGTYSDEPDKF